MNRKNKNIEQMFADGYRPRDRCEWIDAYNKAIYRGGTCGTILSGISQRNMHYVMVEL